MANERQEPTADEGVARGMEYVKKIAAIFEDGEHPATVMFALQLVTASILEDLEVPTSVFANRVELSRRDTVANARRRAGL